MGHGKTGTSYLQSVFANSRQSLAEHGVFYPEDSTCTDAASGKITSGNGILLADFLRNPQQEEVIKVLENEYQWQSVFFSSEWFFRIFNEKSDQPWQGSPWVWEDMPGGKNLESLDGDERINLLKKWAQAHGFSEIRLLLFIRNPISILISSHQQRMKRHGEVRTLEERNLQNPITPAVLACLKLLRRHPEIQLDVRNYSVVKNTLRETVAEWLGISVDVLAIPPIQTVNRSLTRSELELQRCFNHHLGTSGWLLADVLCNELPDIPVEKTWPSIEWQKQLWDRLLPDIEEINAMIEPEHHYQFDGQDCPDNDTVFTFEKAQLEVIAAGISRKIQELQALAEGANTSLQPLQEELAAFRTHSQNLSKELQIFHTKYQEEKARRVKLQGELKSTRNELRTLQNKKKNWGEKLFDSERWTRRWRRWIKKTD